MDLQNIFEAITPDNIKEIPLVKYCMKAFISQLRKDAQVATKISKLYDIDSTDYFYLDENDNRVIQKDSNIVRLSKENLKKGLIQFYLNVLYKLIEETAINTDVKTALTVRSYDSPIFDSINKVLNSEYLGGFRYFQQSSGNKEAINYIYEFSTYLERGYIVSDLNLEEQKPLHLNYTGSLHESMFINFMKKMSHPAGWTYEYGSVTNISDLVDYFGISLDIQLNYIMLDSTAKDFPIIWCFSDVDEIKNLLKTQENYHTGKKYTDEDLADVQFIYIEEQPTIKKYIRRDAICKQYDLSNGMTIYDNGCSYYLSTELFNQINWESQNEIDAYCLLHRNTSIPIYKFLGYRLKPNENINTWHFVYYDESDLEMELFLGSTDNNFYFMEDDSNALNITGEEYHFIQGFDEAYNNVVNYDIVASEYNNSFNIHLEFDTYYLTLFKIYDDYGNGYVKILNKVNREPQILDYSTLNLIGNNLYIEFIDAENGKTYLYINNMNINYNTSITNINYKINNELTITGNASVNTPLNYTSEHLTSSIVVNGDFIHTFDVTNCEQNEDYTITFGSLIIKSNLVKNEINRPNINLPVFSYYNSPISVAPFTSKNRQKGVKSGDGDTFYNYTLDDADVFDNVTNTIYEGTLVRRNYKNDNMSTYINYGYRKNVSESVDCIIPSCTKYVTDEFFIENVNSKGNYLVFEDELDDNVFSNIGRYLYFRNDSTSTDNIYTEGYILNNYSFTNKGDNSFINKLTYEFIPFEQSYYLSFN